MKRTLLVPLVLCVVWLARPSNVAAKANGIPAEGCNGCHRGGKSFNPTITADPAMIDPGASTTLTVHIPAVNGPVAGLYLNSNNVGVFTEIAGEGLRKVSDTTLVHNAPKMAVGSEVTFKVKWTAPAMMGGVSFDLSAVSANHDNSTQGDGEGDVRFNLSYGCVGVDVYLDQDGDGYGISDARGPMRMCSLMPGYSLKGGDCNDYDKRANPDGVEICNLYDDNCNGMINEGLENATVYQDLDGDGYGGRNAKTMIGCTQGFGWSSTHDDCDDNDKDVHPGAMEICNEKDDNCDGRTDENARMSCGVGWCRRLAASCESSACTPGPPRAELCNAFDDDCDGVVDNGPNLCTDGKVCYNGVCVSKQDADDMAAATKAEAPDGGVMVPGNVDGGGSGSGTTGGDGAGSSSGGSSGGSGGGGSTGSGGSTSGSGASQSKLGCRFGDGTGRSGAVSLVGLTLLSLLLRRRRR